VPSEKYHPGELAGDIYEQVGVHYQRRLPGMLAERLRRGKACGLTGPCRLSRPAPIAFWPLAMHVLLTSTPGWGHVHPMVPLAQAFRDRGDEVLWATADEACPRLRGEGFEARPAGLDLADGMEEADRRFPELAELSPLERAGPMFIRIFADVRAPAMLADLLPLVREWKPSIVIHDAAEFAAPIAAALAGVPSVSQHEPEEIKHV
jgi:UDP:flavonoid glycosyltransferase YjiC (YdhE family)